MIEKIRIKGYATYSEEQHFDGLAKHNFIYGSNGTGKTTISKIISNSSIFPDSKIKWYGDRELETFVYNQDFVKANFGNDNGIEGVFSLGEQDVSKLEAIEKAKGELNDITDKGKALRLTLEGEDGKSGKTGELSTLENKYNDLFWDCKKNYSSVFGEAFKGAKSKDRFKERLLQEKSVNHSELKTEEYLTEKSDTLLGKIPDAASKIIAPSSDVLLSLEEATILSKKVIGKEDIDIAKLIEKLDNSDWVLKGQKYIENSDGLCPFCQQPINDKFTDNLNSYFDETYKKDLKMLGELFETYKKSSEDYIKDLSNIIEQKNNFIDNEGLENQKTNLQFIFDKNIDIIKQKISEPSRSFSMDSIKKTLENIKQIFVGSDKKVEEHNLIVSNFKKEKRNFISQVWKFLVDKNELELENYIKEKNSLEKAILSLNQNKDKKTQEYRIKKQEITELEKNIGCSVKPTVIAINDFLNTFGFEGFYLDTYQDKFYKIVRADGSDAKETLSEGEKSFITFLYFYHLIQGSKNESGMNTDRVVVFDDPVSSLDSDILFIVSSLIRNLLDESNDAKSKIKQIFLLTHNIYFHKEVCLNNKRKDTAMRNETFWTVIKKDNVSKIIKHTSNPIKTLYELLWQDIKNNNNSNLSIQNSMRRIIEYYFKILGGFDQKKICEEFEGREKIICGSLFSWMHDGSHWPNDDLYVSSSDSTIDSYMTVFKKIFEVTNNDAHYNMMMER